MQISAASVCGEQHLLGYCHHHHQQQVSNTFVANGSVSQDRNRLELCLLAG
jgi:hypothetical protein